MRSGGAKIGSYEIESARRPRLAGLLDDPETLQAPRHEQAQDGPHEPGHPTCEDVRRVMDSEKDPAEPDQDREEERDDDAEDPRRSGLDRPREEYTQGQVDDRRQGRVAAREARAHDDRKMRHDARSF